MKSEKMEQISVTKKRKHKKTIIPITSHYSCEIYHILKKDKICNTKFYHYQEYIAPNKKLSINKLFNLQKS